ncbi:hypothetical protein DMC30DRAFT_390341 [Rhodotorula diobovata]|uniref:Uncharacterized protein n=1 Tax=Rhodotorula diobovata TaxID=5288 RepID=A0A5C5G1W1_9BASI|nr:hypothetical protein DMC30DRAFT_390341 [Rhodotorula diobovata]
MRTEESWAGRPPRATERPRTAARRTPATGLRRSAFAWPARIALASFPPSVQCLEVMTESLVSAAESVAADVPAQLANWSRGPRSHDLGAPSAHLPTRARGRTQVDRARRARRSHRSSQEGRRDPPRSRAGLSRCRRARRREPAVLPRPPAHSEALPLAQGGPRSAAVQASEGCAAQHQPCYWLARAL